MLGEHFCNFILYRSPENEKLVLIKLCFCCCFYQAYQVKFEYQVHLDLILSVFDKVLIIAFPSFETIFRIIFSLK